MRPHSATRKKSRERSFFDRVHAQIGIWPRGEIDDSGENPDLVIDSPDGKYGVEVTEIVRGPTRAELESKRIICEMAYRRYIKETAIVGLAVKVLFLPNARPTKSDQILASQELFGIVASHFPQATSEVTNLELSCRDDFNSLWFSAIWLHYHPALQRSIWQPVNAWWVPQLSAGNIQKEIEKKEVKLPNYRNRTPRVWLLIVTDGFDGSTASSFGDDTLSQEYVTSFDGVVVLEDALNKATVLRLSGLAK